MDTLLRRYAALYLSLFPVSYLFHFPAKTSHKQLLFLVLALPFIILAVKRWWRGEARLAKPLATASLVLAGLILLSGVTSLFMFPEMSVRRMAGTVGLLTWLMAFLGMATTCDERCLRRALQWLAISTLLSAVVVFILDMTMDFVPGPPTPKLGLGLNTISLGKLLLAAVPGILLMSNHALRFALLLVVSALIFMTGARTIAIALLVTVTTFLLLQGKRARILSTLSVLGVAAVAGILFMVHRGLGLPRLVGLHTLELRFQAWINSIDVWWRMNPITGVGPNMHRIYLHGPFRLPDLPYAFNAGHAHSEYVAALADLGMLGFLAWCALLGVLFFLLWKRRHESALARVSLAIFVGYLVAGITEVHFMRLREMTLVVVVMVLAFSAGVRRSDNASPAPGTTPGNLQTR